jgi:hypothetical protein
MCRFDAAQKRADDKSGMTRKTHIEENHCSASRILTEKSRISPGI